MDAQPEISSKGDRETKVIGLYGISGCGKTYLLRQLSEQLEEHDFAFYEGSEMIASVTPGGLDSFKRSTSEQQTHWRQMALEAIQTDATKHRKCAVVTGHYMFWPEEKPVGPSVCTKRDLEIFTHILYLEVPANVIACRRKNDTHRNRQNASEDHLGKWQSTELAQLRPLCYAHDILLSVLTPGMRILERATTLLKDFKEHTTLINLSRAKQAVDAALPANSAQLRTILLLDGDRTLAAEDSGKLFWKIAFKYHTFRGQENALKNLFSSPMGYSYAAFRQAALLYEELADVQDFDAISKEVASIVTIYPEFVSLLQAVAEQSHIGAIILTCGQRCVWERVLQREGLSGKIKVIAGGRIANNYVISPKIKGDLVKHVQDVHHVSVWAFGDSPLDLGMLIQADHAVVVVGDEQTRSKTMTNSLLEVIKAGKLQAQQVLLPVSVSPRLDAQMLPVIKLTDNSFVSTLLGDCNTTKDLRFWCDTDKNTTRLLATPMRDNAVAGHNLRVAHNRAGWYLAITGLTDILGLEETPIQHVLGRPTVGYRLAHEQKTTIVALMRGGEPMASGVGEAIPHAMFVHAQDAQDIKMHHLEGQVTVILVDSVVNSGKTIIEFVDRIRQLHATIRIVVLAGVVQAQCVSGGIFEQRLKSELNLHLVALRLSETKFTGSGSTDTGNRLFNTIHLA